MSINPFELKAKKTEDTFMSWNELASRPYKKNTVDPYTKTRIILMNGTEYEAVWFGHNFSRKCDNKARAGCYPPRRTAAAKTPRVSQTVERDAAGNDNKLRTACRRPDRFSRAARNGQEL